MTTHELKTRRARYQQLQAHKRYTHASTVLALTIALNGALAVLVLALVAS